MILERALPGAQGLGTILGLLIAAGLLASVLLLLLAPALGSPEISPTRWPQHLSFG